MRAALYTALCLTCIYALWSLYPRGYGLVVVLLAPVVTCLLWRLRRDPMVGFELCWRQGRWTLEHAGMQRVIVPGRRSVATPWLIYVVFTDQSADCRGHLWLYRDCASRAQLRRLRVRLTLDC